MMNAPPPLPPSSSQRASLAWTLAAFGLTLVALFRVGYLLWRFHVGTASLSAGAPIRPMGFILALGITSMASVVLGGGCALVGAILAMVQRRRRLLALAVLAALLAWVPAILSGWGFNYIIAMRKLMLSN